MRRGSNSWMVCQSSARAEHLKGKRALKAAFIVEARSILQLTPSEKLVTFPSQVEHAI